VEQVEHMRIIVVHIAGSVVPEVEVEAAEPLRQIDVATAIYNIESLMGMGVVEPQTVLHNRRSNGIPSRSWERSHQR
jgi:hypothetical protein